MRENETSVKKVRVEKKISYAEAVRVMRVSEKVNVNPGRGASRDQEVTRINTNGVVIDKMALVTFIAGVINTTADVRSKQEKIQLIVKAAINHLGLVGLTWEEVSGTTSIISQVRKHDVLLCNHGTYSSMECKESVGQWPRVEAFHQTT